MSHGARAVYHPYPVHRAKPERLTGRLPVGLTQAPNKVTGDVVFLEWEAVREGLHECEGGGTYSVSRSRFGWRFKYKAQHKCAWAASLHPVDKPLHELIEAARAEIAARYCSQLKAA